MDIFEPASQRLSNSRGRQESSAMSRAVKLIRLAIMASVCLVIAACSQTGRTPYTSGLSVAVHAVLDTYTKPSDLLRTPNDKLLATLCTPQNQVEFQKADKNSSLDGIDLYKTTDANSTTVLVGKSLDLVSSVIVRIYMDKTLKTCTTNVVASGL